MIVEKGLQTWTATILGAVLLLVGIIGFIDNPLVGPDGLFSVNSLHNLVHLLSGAVGLGIGIWGSIIAARWFNKVFGIVYALVAVLGFAGLAGFLDANMADHVLHTILAVVPIGIGFWGKD